MLACALTRPMQLFGHALVGPQGTEQLNAFVGLVSFIPAADGRVYAVQVGRAGVACGPRVLGASAAGPVLWRQLRAYLDVGVRVRSARSSSTASAEPGSDAV
jgi:hypothetical protein